MVIVRIPKNDELSLSTALDAGAAGIIIPHVESAQEVKDMIKEVYYREHFLLPAVPLASSTDTPQHPLATAPSVRGRSPLEESMMPRSIPKTTTTSPRATTTCASFPRLSR